MDTNIRNELEVDVKSNDSTWVEYITSNINNKIPLMFERAGMDLFVTKSNKLFDKRILYIRLDDSEDNKVESTEDNVIIRIALTGSGSHSITVPRRVAMDTITEYVEKLLYNLTSQ